VSFAEVPSIVPQSPEEEDAPDGEEAESEEEDDIQGKDDSPSSASSDRFCIEINLISRAICLLKREF
jgi:hypothetical protein